MFLLLLHKVEIWRFSVANTFLGIEQSYMFDRSTENHESSINMFQSDVAHFSATHIKLRPNYSRLEVRYSEKLSSPLNIELSSVIEMQWGILNSHF